MKNERKREKKKSRPTYVSGLDGTVWDETSTITRLDATMDDK
jgi:hypothetical protein